MDGALVPTRGHAGAAPAKNYRYPAHVQLLIDADPCLLVAVGQPRPGPHNNGTA